MSELQHDPFYFIREIKKTAEDLESLKSGALVAAAGGAFVLGLSTGGLFWIPFAMCAPLACFKLVQWYTERDKRKALQELEIHDIVQFRLESLNNRVLPAAAKQELEQQLVAFLQDRSPTKKFSLPSQPADVQQLPLKGDP